MELDPLSSAQIRMLLGLVRVELIVPRVHGINRAELKHLMDNLELMEMAASDGVITSVGLVR